MMKMTTLIIAVALATIAVFAAEAQATSTGSAPPLGALKKHETVLQRAGAAGGMWHYYDEREPARWTRINFGHSWGAYFPMADRVAAGTRLHVYFSKPERPIGVDINAWPTTEGRAWDYARPAGKRQGLLSTLKPVRQDGKTIGWNVFFRVNEPDRHYYLKLTSRWKRVPGTHISYGHIVYAFHVKTR